MKENFQLIITIVFIVLAIFGVLVFSGAIPIGEQNKPGVLGTVVLWGTVGDNIMSPLLEEFNKANPTFIVKYTQKRAESFDQDLLEALASGSGPDMFLLPDNLALHYIDRIISIPYASYPLASFKNNFAGAGEVFLTSKGVLAFPLSIDPLMMYYNRSLLDADGVVYPPAFWDDLTSLALKLTKKDDSNKIIKSAIAFGHFSNVINAKTILTTLFMQAGNKIVLEKNGIFNSSLSALSANPKYNLSEILKFYTDFADPNKDVYSWNRSFSNSNNVFSREYLIFYFFKLTGANVTGIAILSSSKNFNTAFTAAGLLSAGDFASKFALATGTAPARRDLLKVKPTDSYSSIFYDSALYARSWLDPSPADTDNIFRNMIDKVLSNNLTVENAISDASSKLGLLLLR